MRDYYNKTWRQLTNSNYLTILLVLNFTLFVLVNLSLHIFRLDITPYLAMPLNEFKLLYKPWTLLTYMFLHTDFFHLLFNVLLLYFAGTLFQSILGEKRLLYLYVMSGLAGALFLLVTQLIFPSLSGAYLMGASAAVMGIIAAQAIYTPDYQVQLFFLIQLPFKYFAVITFILSTLLDFSFNTGGKVTHIGGALFGLIYAYYLKKGTDLRDISIFRRKKNKNINSPTYLDTYSNSSREYGASLFIINRIKEKRMIKKFKNDDEYLDYLLDKISIKGYHSLTKEEKDDLIRISQSK